MFRRKRHLCPCCGYLTLEDTSPGSHLICPICFWEDDPLQFQPAYLTGFRSEDSEVPCTVVFSTRGARSRTRQYVEHTKARKRRWVRCIAGRRRKLVRYAG